MKKNMEKDLRKAFSKLLDKKLSVTSLCEKADISRATFYLYYKDIDEFIEKTREYISEKYFDQATEVFFSEEEKLPLLLKEEKLLLDENDRKLLAYFADGSNYIRFAYCASEAGLPKFKALYKEKYGEEFFSENERKILYCLNGITALIFFNLINYDEKKIVSEMLQSRKIINNLLGI